MVIQMASNSRHVTLLQSAEEARKKKSKLIDVLAGIVNAEKVDYKEADWLIKNIETLNKATNILTKEANKPYTS